MNYPVGTSAQLRAVLRALRQSRALSQAQVGALLGVNQKRVAQIEQAPGVTSFDQIARLVATLGGRVTVEVVPPAASPPEPTGKGKGTRQATRTAATPSANW